MVGVGGAAVCDGLTAAGDTAGAGGAGAVTGARIWIATRTLSPATLAAASHPLCRQALRRARGGGAVAGSWATAARTRARRAARAASSLNMASASA